MTSPAALSKTIRHGGCLCGGVRYETTGALRPVVFCHCEPCRRQSGLYFGCTSVTDEALFIEGPALRWFGSSPDVRRGFCGTCGTPLFWKHEAKDETSILAGSFDQPSGLTASHHIYVAAKGDFYELPADGLPRFDDRDPTMVLGSAENR